ncbi:MAG TPA: type II CRISPR RNA-guided endonuclease Cas9 [Candidatus Bathyarchaeia archaeon]|nr:type II CRISPR RNA-guided endonuclease Cas9 [Candidatus Bathyarchaeia archaeon]
MAAKTGEQTILGLDLGANSVGWALIRTSNGEPEQCLAMGVRIFDAAVGGTLLDLQAGKEQSPNVKRRNARMLRRQTERRARRRIKVAHLLQEARLLPSGDLDTLAQRHEFFLSLDRAICARHMAEAPTQFLHTFPYWLRARALDIALAPDELGRALYHLAQRRGFLSNRKSTAKEDEDSGTVKPAIEELASQMAESGARTLGEFLSRIDPADPHQRRIRERWTSRQMYKEEFNAIWQAQQPFHPELLTTDIRNRLFQAVFFQRPLRIQKHLIGMCQFEFRGYYPRRRAPLALLAAQRFRLLQKVNDLCVVAPDFSERPLTAAERELLLDKLETHDEYKFDQIRRLFKLSKDYTFNFERGGEKRLFGNRTAARLAKIFGEQWCRFSPEQRDAIVDEIRSYDSETGLAERGIRHYGLDAEAAKKLGSVKLQPGYCGLSRQALSKLLPLMEKGIPYMTAVKEIYKEDETMTAVACLPSLRNAVEQRLMSEIRNPVVTRVLTETRKVVNAVIQKYGKPELIRIELARDVKKSRDERKRIWTKNRNREKQRISAALEVLRETGNEHPNAKEVELVLLHEECGGICPYTGQSITIKNLLSGQSRFDVEHIVPFSRCLDNSFGNKTLCLHEENRSVKKNKTPWEAYGESPERWDEIVERVKHFKGDGRDGKLRRFLMKDLADFDEFSTRMLNDTRYSSRLAGQYVSLLYGSEHRKHIQVSSGMVTAYLRDLWKLNKILSDGGAKNRDDHRHHAIDAVVIALTGPALVKSLSDAAKSAPIENRRRPGIVPPPWDSFLEDVQQFADGIVVSHRVARKVNGRLHEDTFYSPQPAGEEGKPRVHVRKRLESLSPDDVKNIVDPMVREAVIRKLEQTGVDPKKAFAQRENHPSLRTRDGRTIPIHKVRVCKNQEPFQVGRDGRERFVTNDSNHHMEVVEIKGPGGRVKWEGAMVSQYEALRRHKSGLPVINRDHGEGKRLLFSLAPGETFQIDDDKSGEQQTYIVRSISNGNVEIVSLTDSRKALDIKKAKEWLKRSADKLRQLNCRKVVVTPLGEIRRAND